MDKAFSFKDVQIDMSDIPSYASLDEAVLYVAEANEILFNNLKREIGLNELGVFETTGNTISYVVEAEGGLKDKAKAAVDSAIGSAKAAGSTVINKGGELKDKVFALIDAIAGKIKGLFETALRKLNELSSKVSSAFGNRLNKEKLVAGADKYKIKFSSGQYDNLLNFMKGSEGNSDLYNILSAAAIEVNIEEEVKKEVGGTGKDDLVKYFEGTKSEVTLDGKGAGEICDIIGDFSKNNTGIKKMYKDSSDFFKKLKKDVKSADEIDNEKLNRINSNLKILTFIVGTALSSYYRVVNQDAVLLIKLNNKVMKDEVVAKAKEVPGKAADAAKGAVKAAKEAPGKAVDAVKEKLGKKDEKANESAVVEESTVEEEPATKTYTEEVESLFNWSF